jgi:uncharacterized protein YqgV (UPF0045/DUF77 family)
MRRHYRRSCFGASPADPTRARRKCGGGVAPAWSSIGLNNAPGYGEPVANARLEVLVEPFRESDPGAHDTSVVAYLEQSELAVDIGRFATVVTGQLATITRIGGELPEAGFSAGASAIQRRVNVTEP